MAETIHASSPLVSGVALRSTFEALLERWEQIAPTPPARPDDPRLRLERATCPFEQLDSEIRRRVAALPGSSGEAELASVAAGMPRHAELVRQRMDSGLRLLQPGRKRLKTSRANQTGPPHLQPPGASLGETVFSVTLFHPVKGRLQQQLLALGSQHLSALRDQIYCLKDTTADGHQCNSGFFFIENTFYNDLRAELAVEYSSCIVDWAAKHGWQLRKNLAEQELKQARMETARLDQIGLLPGEQYLYCHQGNCEHILVFDQVEAVTGCADPAKYPFKLFDRQQELRKCSICNIHTARRVTYRDRLAPEEPCFFCEICYRQLHYSEDGYLLYDDFEQYECIHE